MDGRCRASACGVDARRGRRDVYVAHRGRMPALVRRLRASGAVIRALSRSRQMVEIRPPPPSAALRRTRAARCRRRSHARPWREPTRDVSLFRTRRDRFDAGRKTAAALLATLAYIGDGTNIPRETRAIRPRTSRGRERLDVRARAWPAPSTKKCRRGVSLIWPERAKHANRRRVSTMASATEARLTPHVRVSQTIAVPRTTERRRIARRFRR